MQENNMIIGSLGIYSLESELDVAPLYIASVEQLQRYFNSITYNFILCLQ